MTSKKHRTSLARVFTVLGFTLATGAATASSVKMAETVTPAADLTYENINPAIAMATAFGDRAAGPHGTFGRFPANFTTPFHTHSGAYHGIVVKGVMTNPFKGETNPPKMQAGSYWHVPAGSIHATACVSDTPCEFYFHADEGFDFGPAE